MVESQENFDNICINSQDSDFDFEIKSNLPDDNIKKLSPNSKESQLTIYYKNNKKFPNGHDMKKILIDESSSDSDEVTFIREISKPLLRTGNKKKLSKKRLNLKYRKQLTRIIGICFIGAVILGILVFCVFLLVPNNTLKYLQNKLWNGHINSLHNNKDDVVGCDELSIDDVWIKSYPKLITEGAVRLLKINEDEIFDFVIPFGTNVREEIVCKIYFPGQERCFGGLLAVDGATGKFLWRYDAIGEMYALVCLEDLNQDGWIDCLGAGRQGAFAAVSGRDGNEIWAFDKNAERNTFMNLYTAQFIDDINGDGIRDILQMHGGDPVAKPNEMNRLIAKVMIFSGKTGVPLMSKIVPDLHESYYSPQLINLGDGVKTIIFGTGGETFPGSLFKLNLNSFLSFGDNKKLKLETIYKAPKKGVMTPPILVDLNRDKRPDIVLCPFADECFALDGVTLKEIWKFDSLNNSETYVTPAAGFYNDDDVPDIFIQYFVGLGYPVYFYGETLILDGRNGKLLKKLHRSNNLVITSPLTLSVEGYGNDLFLYWLQLCRGHETDTKDVPFQNLPQYILARAHVCKIRFNTTTESLFLIHGQHIKNQSVNYGQLYNSEKYFHLERAHVINVTQQVEEFLQRNPQYRHIYELYRSRLEITDLSKADSSYAKENNNRHESIVKEQLKSNKIDLNDKFIHGSIDFTKPDVDQSNANQYDQFSDSSFSNLENKKHRFIRSSKEKLMRFKRHNGPHDAEGLQRLISTGTLAPPLLDKNDKFYDHSMDIVFATYWSEAKEIVLQTKLEMKCNSKWEKLEYQRFTNNSKYFYYDHDHYSKYGNLYCAKKYGYRQPVSNNENQSTMFNNHFGELTIYRKRIKCTCSPGRVQATQRCSRLLPFHLQTWPAYLGLSGSAYWNSSITTLKLRNRV